MTRHQYRISASFLRRPFALEMSAVSRDRIGNNSGSKAWGGGGFSHTLPIRVCAAQRVRDFEAPDLERDIHFRGVF